MPGEPKNRALIITLGLLAIVAGIYLLADGYDLYNNFGAELEDTISELFLGDQGESKRDAAIEMIVGSLLVAVGAFMLIRSSQQQGVSRAGI